MGLVAYMMIDEYMMTFYHFAWLPILYITGLDKRKKIYWYVFLSRVQEFNLVSCIFYKLDITY